MKEQTLTLRGFFGYQYEPQAINRTDLVSAVHEAFELAGKDLSRTHHKKIQIEYVQHEIASGQFILSKIFEQIESAHFCLFDMSEGNQNVCLEMGYALGRKKPVIVQLFHDNDLLSIPSDLRGVSICKVNASSIANKVGKQVLLLISELLKDEGGLRTLSNRTPLLWGLSSESHLSIVCPEIPESVRLPYANPETRDYLRLAKFADIDSLYYLKAFFDHEFPHVKISEFTCRELPNSSSDGCLVIVGGPAWNTLAATLMQHLSVPWEFHDGGDGNDDYLKRVDGGESLQPRIGTDGAIQSDISLFARLPNPFGGTKPLFLISGIRTHGVLAASRMFADSGPAESNAEFIINRLGPRPYFVVVARSSIINGFAATPLLETPGHLIELLQFDVGSKSYLLIERGV